MFTYDPGKYTVIVGAAMIGGFADGTFVKASRSSQAFTKHVGADGIVARVRNRDKSGEIVLTLLQTSPSNDYLSALVISDEQSGAGVVPVFIKDGNGRTVVGAAYGWVRKPADVENGKEIGNREWTIDTADMDIFVGGSEA